MFEFSVSKAFFSVDNTTTVKLKIDKNALNDYTRIPDIFVQSRFKIFYCYFFTN